MKVLLTGANGFVGSHVLDLLLARDLPVAVLLRPTASRRFIEPQLARVEIRLGALDDRASLESALAGVTHLVHCAGSTKARDRQGFFEVNVDGTGRLLEAVHRQRPGLERFVHLSSLAAVGPAPAEAPAREEDAPHPVSAYGESKLASERVLRERGRVPWVILRPPGVYGPRDPEFLRLFKAVKARVCPDFGGGRHPFSLAFASDLAEAVVVCLEHPAAPGKTYHVAGPERVTAGAFARAVAGCWGTRVWTPPLPLGLLWPVCALQEAVSRATRRASVLNRQKYAELAAPGWVCDTGRLRAELGFDCRTPLAEGVRRTADWYREQGWL